MGRTVAGSQVVVSSTASTGSSSSVIDPRKEGLPLYHLHGTDGNQYRTSIILDGDFQPVSDAWAALLSTTTSYGSGLHSDSMIGYNGDVGATSASLSSQGSTSWNYWTKSIHQNDQYPFSMYTRSNHRGNMDFVSIHYASQTGKLGRGQYLINQVLPEGVRPRRWFSVNGSTMYESGHYNLLNRQDDSINLSTLDMFSEVTSFSYNRGACCYNERTKKLAISWAVNASTQWYFIVSSTKDLNKDGLQEFWANATLSSSFVGTGQWNSQTYYWRNMVLGDNDKIAVSQHESNTHYFYVFDVDGTRLVNTSQGSTTSYSANNDTACYEKMNTTWDNKWAALYASYYYYGGGPNVFFVSTENPEYYYKDVVSWTNGGALMPHKERGFVFLRSDNHNSQGSRISYMNFEEIDVTQPLTTQQLVGDSASRGGYSLYTPGQSVNFENSDYSVISGVYYSTNYPCWSSVYWWPRENNEMYTGA